MLLHMQDGIIYGPIKSRRLGNSLGINLLPAKDKLCSFNCIYCHYGWTIRHTADYAPYRDHLPTRQQVIHAVEEAMKSDLDFSYITFSGNGEPTQHPDFATLVDDISELRDKYRPDVKTALLSNTSGLTIPTVHDSIARINFPMFKLDAGTEAMFKAINRPARPILFSDIIRNLSTLSNILIQSILVDGTPCNTTDDELAAYFGHLKKIQPREVHIYSIDRSVPKAGIELVPPNKLEEIAAQGRAETGCNIIAFYPGKVVQ